MLLAPKTRTSTPSKRPKEVSRANIGSSKIDRLSFLPSELLDYVFEIAASNYELAPIPPSKRYLSSHTRSLFRHLEIKSGNQLEQIAARLEANPNKALYVKQISWRYDESNFEPRCAHPSRLLERVPNLIAMDFGVKSTGIITLIARRPHLVTSLKLCSLSQQALSSPVADWLSKNPNLRQVEIALTDSWEVEDRPVAIITAPQVTKLSFTTGDVTRPNELQYPSSIHRFFPSAQLVAVDLEIPDSYGSWGPSIVDSLDLFFRQVSPTISSIRLSHRSSTKTLRLNHLLPRFPHLLHLHLDYASYSEKFHTHLLGLKDLTSLTLSFKGSPPKHSEIVDLLSTFRQLQNLRLITFDYSPLRLGPKFDMDLVETEVMESKLKPKKDSIPGSEVANNLEQLTGWELPFPAQNIKHSIVKVLKAEKRIKELGIEVRSNINEVIQLLYRAIVEFHNRAIGETYFFKSIDNLEAAHYLAAEWDLKLPPIEIDSDNLGRDKLEWVTVDMTKAVRGGGKKCIAYTLRYRP